MDIEDTRNRIVLLTDQKKTILQSLKNVELDFSVPGTDFFHRVLKY